MFPTITCAQHCGSTDFSGDQFAMFWQVAIFNQHVKFLTMVMRSGTYMCLRVGDGFVWFLFNEDLG